MWKNQHGRGETPTSDMELENAEVYRSHDRVGAGKVQTDAARDATKVWISTQHTGEHGRKSCSPQRVRRDLRKFPWRGLRLGREGGFASSPITVPPGSQ